LKIAAVLAVVAALSTSAATIPSQQIERDGVSVEFLPSANAVAGEDVDLRFALRGADGSRLSGVRPAAWLDARTGDGTCKDKIQSFMAGSLRARPQVDLNTYYVITLNVEPSVAVIDPLLGFGGSKLLTAVTLQSPGVDWALSSDQRRLFVSMPLVNRVAVIDTESWSVVKNVETAYKPSRLVMQGGQLWVATEKAIDVVDTKNLDVTATIAVGRGSHQIAFGPDAKRAFVTNGLEGTLSVIDAASLKKVADVKTGTTVAGVAFSPLGNALYAIDGKAGTIAVVDAGSLKVTKTIEAKPGLNSVQFAPGGRWGFVTNGKENVVHVLDSSTSAIVTTATDVGIAPDQVAFTDDFAYVRAAGSDQVKMIRLADLGKEKEANMATFPAGQMPPAAAETVSFAAAIVPAPEPKAVLVANPADKLVYYFMEGMAAPMGNFSASKRTPKAALVLDRSLRESEPGVFSIRTKVPAPGTYDVAFFLNDPRVVHCFEMSVAPNPQQQEAADLAVTVEPRIAAKAIRAGQELEVQFKLTSAKKKEPRDAKDVRALAFKAPGTWQKRIAADALGDGMYRVKFTVPEPGIYYVFVESQTLRLRVNESRPVIFEALAP
jgi:YVTN family beta-propeller protein